MTIHDLKIRAFEVKLNSAIDKTIYRIDIDGYVIIKRDDKLYKVRIRQTYDMNKEDHWPTMFNHCIEAFEERCKQVRDNWIVSEGEELEGLMGKVIREEPFEF